MQTFYLVQPFRGARPLPLRRFESATAADQAGQSLARQHTGATVIEIEGDPEWDVWEEPEVVGRYGRVPVTAA